MVLKTSEKTIKESQPIKSGADLFASLSQQRSLQPKKCASRPVIGA